MKKEWALALLITAETLTGCAKENPTRVAATETFKPVPILVDTSTATRIAPTETDTSTPTFTTTVAPTGTPTVTFTPTRIYRKIPENVGFYGSSTAKMQGDVLQNPGVVARIKARFPEIKWIGSFGSGGTFLHDLAKAINIRAIIPIKNIPQNVKWFLIGARNDGKFNNERGKEIAQDTRQEITAFKAEFGNDSVGADVIPYPVPGMGDTDQELVTTLEVDTTILGDIPLIDVRKCYNGTGHLGTDQLHAKDMEANMVNTLQMYQDGTCATIYP